MLSGSRAYAEFDSFFELLAPDSPFGRDAKAALGLSQDASVLELAWDDTDAVLKFLADAKSTDADRLRHHLGRASRFPHTPRTSLDTAEVFQVKKFLHHFASIAPLAGSALTERFDLACTSAALIAELNRGRQSPETFYLADEYSAPLAAVRAQLRDADAQLAALASARSAEVRARWGLDLVGRDFAIVERSSVADGTRASELLSVEPYDEARVVVRLLPSGEALALQSRREQLAEDERAAEASVLGLLSETIADELPSLLPYAAAVARFDLAFARARLARAERLVRPTLGDQIVIEAGRLPACERLCERFGTPYVPLDLTLDGRPVVIFGSNMGGKTIALKTVAFLQLAAQAGLFVPADRYVTRLFTAVVCVGEGATPVSTAGLSGFGREVQQLATALDDPGALLLFDEFARTTGSIEAEALIGAVVERLAGRASGQSLFSTHFRGVARLSGVRFLRMWGLKSTPGGGGRPISDGIADLNRHMDFTLTDDDGSSHGSDALVIARALGLDPALVDRASELLRTTTS